MILLFVMSIIENIGGSWTDVVYDVVNAVQFTTYFVAMALLCVFAFVKLNKPFACIAPFMLALSNLPRLVVNMINCYNSEEFEASYHHEDILGRYDHYTYTDYMTIKFCYWAFIATLVLSFVAFGVYLILASGKKAGNTVKKLWFIPAILSSISVVVCIASYGVEFALYYVGLYKEIWEMALSSLIGLSMELAVHIPQFVAFAFFCKWISNPYKKVSEAEKIKEEKTEVEESKKTEPVVEKVVSPIPPKPAAPVPQPKPVSAAQKAASTVAPPPIRPVAPVQSRPAPMQSPASAPVPSNQVSTMAQKNNIELIKQYKELLDMGAISQEEYEEKKKKLLTD